MPASSSKATQINHVRTRFNGNAIATAKRYGEKATQTFNQGVPLQLSAGELQECATINNAATALIAGFGEAPGNNLTTGSTAQTLNTGFKVPNQASAVVIPIGAPPNDGTMGVWVADDNNEFIGTYGDSADNTLATLTAALKGSIRGLTKDAGNSFWYVDNNKTTVAAGACVEITDIVDAVTTLNGKVIFRVLKAAQQLQS